jgi:hypothetical protein
MAPGSFIDLNININDLVSQFYDQAFSRKDLVPLYFSAANNKRE